VAERVFAAGYLEGVATRPDCQRQGFGSMVVRRATTLVRERYELGGLSTSRPAFYQRLGWERWHGPAFVRVGDDLVRTPDEDAGVLVLRFGPSAGLNLAAPIACESRPADDW
jgi:aminoglycoside 2'-N-acetyltransferase I